MKRVIAGTLIFLTIILCGCKVVKVENIRVENLDYTIVRERDIPEELLAVIREKKTEPFEMTYEFEGYLYLAKGYGKKEMGGYSISVLDLYLGKNAIYAELDLIGPKTAKEKTEGVSYPYIVVKLEGRREPVFFQ